MAVILYKAGISTKVRGIPCEILICNEYSYLHNLEAGYFYSPEECYAEAEETDPEETEQEAEPEAEEETEADEPKDAEPVLTEALTAEEIRAMAKEAGITNWHTKKIENLLAELEDLTDAE